MLYGIEAWYPSYAYLQNYIERVKKYAARLTIYDIRAEYPSLLERLDWKPISQMVMERRAIVAPLRHWKKEDARKCDHR